MTKTISLIAVCFLVCSASLFADNPLIEKQGVCDGHAHIFGDLAYLFTTHDFNPHGRGWDMRDWQLFSSPDLIHWTKQFVLKPKDTYIQSALTHCFATDGASRNCKYYFYFSNGQANTGVARSDSPDGPYVDALRHPLVTSYDPTAFIDDDAGQTPYLVWGAVQFKIAKLNNDMISLAEPERNIKMLGWKDIHDGSYLHKKNGVYYLTSQRGYYGTSTNVYGPYTYVGRITPFGHDDYVDHPTFFSWHGQDFFVRNYPGSSPYYRSLRMTYVHYKLNGELVTDETIYRSNLGVGQYDAAIDKIQAGWFIARGGSLSTKESLDGGFEVQNIRDRDFLDYPNIKNLRQHATISFQLSAVTGGQIEVHADNSTGKLLGDCNVGPTGGFDKYQAFSCLLSNDFGTANLCLVFRGGSGDLMHFDWFSFAK